MALRGDTNEARIWNFLKDKGLSDHGAAGLMGNLYAESALNPHNLQNTYEKKLGYTDDSYTAAVDSGSYTNFVKDSAGYGLAQWTYWSRKEGLLSYVRSLGKSVGDLEAQLGYLYKELGEGYAGLLATLKTATSVRTASDAVLTKYERPADQSASVQAKRASYGEGYFTKYAGGSGSQQEPMKGGTHMISNCGHDENNKYTGGAAGDQTGGEWALINWYNRPWNCVLRHPDAQVRAEIAKLAKAAAQNDLVGYDQGQRYTFWEHLKASNYDPAQITVKCEADCSSGVAAIVKAVGYRLDRQKLKDVSIYIYTGNEKAALKAAGFDVLTASKYLTGPDYLLAGDILLNENAHTATNITDGSKAITESASSGETSKKKTVAEIADEVIAGKWGNGSDRKSRLAAAGYDYTAVQNAVNAKLSGKTVTPTKSNTEIAKEVIAGKWGNGSDRKKQLEAAGYNYAAVQKLVNEMLR